MTAAILTALGALLALVAWAVKRHFSPNPTEKLDDIRAEYAHLADEMDRARTAGDHATAESLRRRLLKLLSDHAAQHRDRTPGE